ncbi:bis(5-nucleosyl)-tetraphosphatase [Grosmannia clavigera kw1407]|uniref:Bis(5-nucleosyl)-tetraphosphatase n=1 Tax=Grosmannia clavigera (strain kw1407 / UAMH 11150) TaxID=655863 RepID=F0XPI3_GROCL|nr:bis(5-nucleosyl)-tetraphosphatase [Grosmannia clavigera kw1407]EFX00297.1 bis(5-nucleosyl)-tetraphosphatase [Grosmannia clavigera kw1407]
MVQLVSAPSNLPDLVRTAFARARAAGDLTFFPTQVALLRINGIPLQLRFAPSLAKKPKTADASKSASHSGPTSVRPSFDPFENPPPGLLVLSQIGPAHRLVLNKFAICRDHAILATVDFRPQSHLLAGDDLAAAYACIEAYHDQGQELFVFYNSGAHSGASQPHRHLQMLPVACMREGLSEDGSGSDASVWGVAVDQLTRQTAASTRPAELPFHVATTPIHRDEASPSAELLHALYLRLYRQACVAAGLSAQDGMAEEQGQVPARLSYNLALTQKTMALCPRTAEGSAVTSSDGTSVGTLSLNGTVLAGTALVKNETEWSALRQDPGQLTRILRQIGLPAGSVSSSKEGSAS